jgi:hypothetical protein
MYDPTLPVLMPVDLDALPVGAVVLDHATGADTDGRAGGVVGGPVAWTKTDHTMRTETETAWTSVFWAMDRTSEELVTEFGPLTLLWPLVSETEPAPAPAPAPADMSGQFRIGAKVSELSTNFDDYHPESRAVHEGKSLFVGVHVPIRYAKDLRLSTVLTVEFPAHVAPATPEVKEHDE